MRNPLLLLVAALAASCASVAPPREAAPPAHAAYAWATFDEKGITGSAAAGLADRASGRALTLDDPVRIASISKLVVALGAMRLVEQGRLDLDRDVSDYLGWRLRNPAFPGEAITLRMLLSHRSSLRDEVDYVIPLGGSVEARLGDAKAYDPAHRPGSFYRYSNLGFPVIATAMEKAGGERFDRLIDRLVLRPMKLDACFNWSTCSDAAAARAVVLYSAAGEVLRDDHKGKRPACLVVPAADGSCDLSTYRIGTHGGLFSPQGGLRISVRDLAAVGRLLLRKGRLADGRRLLSEAGVAEMMRPAWRFDGANGEQEKGFYCGYGLSVQILAQCPPKDDPVGDGRTRFGHAGDAYGVKSGLWIDPVRGTGIAYFATGIADEAKGTRSAYWAIEEWLAAKAR
ncbi:MAG TPA: serine hydrolase domain-containing protein [Allosphingosinicella sp.]